MLVEQSLGLFLSLLKNITGLLSFIFILWQLSGALSLNVAGHNVTLHGYLVWVALGYAAISSLLAHRIGRPLHKLNIDRQKNEADYRASLLRIRESNEQIAFYGGERAELRRIRHYFSVITHNWQRIMSREFRLETFTTTYFRLSLMIPISAVLPLYIAKKISLGGVMQARAAFGYVLDAFGWFIDSYRQIVAWSATVERLWQFEQSLIALPTIAKYPRHTGKFHCRNLVACHTHGAPLFNPISLDLQHGESIAIVGSSGCGKTTFLRVLSGLWPYSTGVYSPPTGKTLFVPQQPYLPDDLLTHVLTYPCLAKVSNERLESCLKRVGLEHLCPRLNKRQSWGHILSGGEQQRLSFARILLNMPDLICLDESTSHLDDMTAIDLISTIRSAPPQSIIMVVSHQKAVIDSLGMKYSIEKHYLNKC